MASKSPTQRSVDWLRQKGWQVAVVEKWMPKTNRRSDLFGFADLFAVKEGHKPQLIQVTTNPHSTDRRRKIVSKPAALVCLRAGIDVVVHGWKKPTHFKRRHWALAIYPVSEDMFAAGADALPDAGASDTDDAESDEDADDED